MDFTWEVSPDLHGSDHYPILLSSDTAVPTPNAPWWRLNRADWDLFSALASFPMEGGEFKSVDQVAASFTSVLHSAGLRSIPRTSGTFGWHSIPWWSDACRATIRA